MGWYDYIKEKAINGAKAVGNWIWETDKAIVSKAASILPAQTMGPAGAVVSALKTSETIGTSMATGIKINADPWANLFKSVDNMTTGDVLTNARSTSSSSSTIDQGKPDSGITLPFWVKTAIVLSAVVGTAMLIKGSLK